MEDQEAPWADMEEECPVKKPKILNVLELRFSI